MEDRSGIRIGERIEVKAHWGSFTGTVIRIVDLRPVQLVIQRDDTQSIVAVRIEYCKKMNEAEH